MNAEKLQALADRIDHEQLWRRAPFERDTLTADQRDRMDAAVELRRYADLLGSETWRIYPPRPGISFRAGTLDKVVDMARRDDARQRPSDAVQVCPECDIADCRHLRWNGPGRYID